MMYKSVLDVLLEWLHNNTDKPLRITDIAARSGYSPWHLQRIFKSHTGVTLGQYVTELKLNKAFELLSTTRTPIMDVSFIVGFSSQQSFSRRFHQYFGKTPGQVRRDMTEKRERV
ncbi:helix-turn-helix transcriptional regulator [Citrobacter koseri]|nr:helix-turn-helix transcriptional regulator [Citrobacter koseri]EKU8894963.1 helix-turn-helix transcriptional regulator [Citrobacter koseri]MBJ9303135.1 helix-turn-helix transcriptional regulator [Citrobacter koseri]MBJ9367641.1 helix-turn-helix transcriptional regulator [Citrobacter koseri]HAT2781208.1 helix-turn-helix transcriptional regulator [Citrobacter koseri]